MQQSLSFVIIRVFLRIISCMHILGYSSLLLEDWIIIPWLGAWRLSAYYLLHVVLAQCSGFFSFFCMIWYYLYIVLRNMWNDVLFYLNVSLCNTSQCTRCFSSGLSNFFLILIVLYLLWVFCWSTLSICPCPLSALRSGWASQLCIF